MCLIQHPRRSEFDLCEIHFEPGNLDLRTYGFLLNSDKLWLIISEQNIYQLRHAQFDLWPWPVSWYPWLLVTWLLVWSSGELRLWSHDLLFVLINTTMCRQNLPENQHSQVMTHQIIFIATVAGIRKANPFDIVWFFIPKQSFIIMHLKIKGVEWCKSM